MKCFNCGYDRIDHENRHCPVCSVELSNICSNCSSFNPKTAKYCANCGTSLETEIIKEKEEKIKAGVIFADISGFTSLAEKLEPKETKNIINKCFQSITKPVYELNGSVDKFIGDCVMVTFGINSQIDVPLRTITCAVEMMKAIDQFAVIYLSETGISLNLSIGATYGDVILGHVGTANESDYTVIGDTVNVASRLQSYSKPGEIAINESLYSKTLHIVTYSEQKFAILKNKEKPVEYYNITNLNLIKEQDTIIHKNEMDYVKSYIENPLENEILELVGESGIGKSTILQHIHEQYMDDSILLKLKATDQTLPNNAIYQLLIAIFGVDSKDKKGLLEALNESYKTQESDFDKKRNSNFMKIILRLPLDTSYDPIIKSMDYNDLLSEIKVQWSLYIQNSLFDRKVILIDDCDTMDAGSQELLDELKDLNMKIIVTSKSSVFNTNQLHIQPFTLSETTQMITNHLEEEVPLKLVHKIVELSNGNPLYIKSLCDTIQTLKIDVNKEKDFDKLPNSLSQLYVQLFFELDEITQEILQYGSLFYADFSIEKIALISNTNYKESIVDKLMDLSILEVVSYYRKDNKTYNTFTFKQDAFKKVCYDSMFEEDIPKKAKKISEYLIQENKLKSDIAYYLELSNELELACQYNLIAAKSYNEQRDFTLAIKYYDNFIRLSKKIDRFTTSEVAQTFIELSRIMLLRSKYEEALAYIDEGLNISGFTDLTQHLQLLQVEAYKALGNIDGAMGLLTKLEKTVPKTSNNYGKLLQLLSTIYNMTGQPGVIELCDKSKDILIKTKDYESLAETLTQAGIRYFMQGKLSNGIEYLENALSFASNINNKALMSKIMINLGILYNQFGEKDKSNSYLINAIEISKEISNSRNFTSAAINLGVSYLHNASFSKASNLFKETIRLATKSKLLYQLCISLTNLGDAQVELGEYEEALQNYEQALDLSIKMNLPIEQDINKLGIIKVQLRQGITSMVKSEFEDLIKNLLKSKEFTYLATVYIEFAEYYIQQNNLELASDMIDKGIEISLESKDEEVLIKAYIKYIEIMQLLNLDGVNSLFDTIVEKASNSGNYYELAKLYLIRYKHTLEQKYLKLAKEMIDFFDNCTLKEEIVRIR